jgi:NitT/TauT family transport system ATP-binding protein
VTRASSWTSAGPLATGVASTLPAATGRIELRDVAVSFPAGRRERLEALDAVDLAIEAGEIVSLIGPNGSGKSTLLRVIAGLLVPDRGAVLLDGEAIAGPDPRIGLVFQDPRLLPWRTILRNVAYPLELAGWPSRDGEARVGELLERVDLAAAAGSVPSQLSGGMRQRAALARSMALEPSILLLDEPFSALDELTRERFDVELLRSWTRPGTTIVVVTHSVQEAIFLADRVVVLSERPGRVVADLRVPLPRPRSIDRLDEATVGATAREIRRHLGAIAA